MINYYLIHLLYQVKYVKQGLNNSMMAKIETEENPAEMGRNIFCWCTLKKTWRELRSILKTMEMDGERLY